MKAFISVTNKDKLFEFAKELVGIGWEIICSGGTAKALQKAGLPITDIKEYTGMPELFDGRIKSLHHKIYGGVLCDFSNPLHCKQAQEQGIQHIELVVVNFYNFKEHASYNKTLEEVIEYIDIGGPSIIRACAKNYLNSTPVVDPNDYELIINELKTYNKIRLQTRMQMAAKAFKYTYEYEKTIYEFFQLKIKEISNNSDHSVTLNDEIVLKLNKVLNLRYGENPHQLGGLYNIAFNDEHTLDNSSINDLSKFKIWGKELSYNNLLDIYAGISILQDLKEYKACVIIKHNNPCAAAIINKDDEQECIFTKALKTDPKSAFGGIILINANIDIHTAQLIAQNFYEAVIAPSFDKEALDILQKKKNLIILKIPSITNFNNTNLEFKSIGQQILVQSKDKIVIDETKIQIVTNNQQLSEQQKKDLIFAFTIAKHAKSNAIVYAKNGSVLGIGAGQMSRIDAAKLAFQKAQEQGHSLHDAVMASDGFFPFKDCVELAASLGISAIIAPGGSLRDKESIEECNKHNIVMIFSGIRHFKH